MFLFGMIKENSRSQHVLTYCIYPVFCVLSCFLSFSVSIPPIVFCLYFWSGVLKILFSLKGVQGAWYVFFVWV